MFSYFWSSDQVHKGGGGGVSVIICQGLQNQRISTIIPLVKTVSTYLFSFFKSFFPFKIRVFTILQCVHMFFNWCKCKAIKLLLPLNLKEKMHHKELL